MSRLKHTGVSVVTEDVDVIPTQSGRIHARARVPAFPSYQSPKTRVISGSVMHLTGPFRSGGQPCLSLSSSIRCVSTPKLLGVERARAADVHDTVRGSVRYH